MRAPGINQFILPFILPLCLPGCSRGGGNSDDTMDREDLAAQHSDLRQGGTRDLSQGDLRQPPGMPSFGGPVAFPGGSVFGALAAADFNRDGKPDLAVASSNGRGGAIHLNKTL